MLNAPRYSNHFEDGPFAASHIMHRIKPTHPSANFMFFHASSPKIDGNLDVRVDRVNDRGIVQRVCPSCHFPASLEFSESLLVRDVELTGTSLIAIAPRPPSEAGKVVISNEETSIEP
jgi:hypothetical protein